MLHLQVTDTTVVTRWVLYNGNHNTLTCCLDMTIAASTLNMHPERVDRTMYDAIERRPSIISGLSLIQTMLGWIHILSYINEYTTRDATEVQVSCHISQRDREIKQELIQENLKYDEQNQCWVTSYPLRWIHMKISALRS